MLDVVAQPLIIINTAKTRIKIDISVLVFILYLLLFLNDVQ